MDGHSLCGPRTYSLIDAPSYLTIDGDSLTITSNSIDDELQEHAVILKVSLNDYSEFQYQEITIQASIDCPMGTICNLDPDRSPETIPEVGCNSGPPKYLAEFAGVSGPNS